MGKKNLSVVKQICGEYERAHDLNTKNPNGVATKTFIPKKKIKIKKNGKFKTEKN